MPTIDKRFFLQFSDIPPMPSVGYLKPSINYFFFVPTLGSKEQPMSQCL